MKTLIPVLCLFLGLSAADRALAGSDGTQYRNFRLGGVGAFQGSGATYSMSGEVAWSPTTHLAGPWGLRGNLSSSVLKSLYDTNFVALNGSAYLTIQPLPFLEVEAGGGLEYWINNGGLAPTVGGNLAVPLHLFGLVNRLYLGASNFFLKSANALEARAGVGFHI